MYQWWGTEEGYSREEVACYVQHVFIPDRFPQTYGLFLGEQLIGIYQIMLCDFELRPDISPWLANVYIDKPFRKSGFGRILMDSVRNNILNNTGYSEIFLYTFHENLYEKFGWELISEIDTFRKKPRIQKLYRLKCRP